MTTYHNFYECEDCDEQWEDEECDSGHNDHCPSCDAEIEPYKSEITEYGTEIRISVTERDTTQGSYVSLRYSCSPRHDSPNHIECATFADALEELVRQLDLHDITKHPITLDFRGVDAEKRQAIRRALEV